MSNVWEPLASREVDPVDALLLPDNRCCGSTRFGPVPAFAAMITLVSHGGVNVDPDAARDPDLFDTCLHEGFAEVLGLAGGGAVTDLKLRGPTCDN
jgi:hypothetical protein